MSYDVCTWKTCHEMALFPQLDRDENQWANLCEKHHRMLENAIIIADAKLLLKYWVLASGGAEKMARKF